MVLALTLLVAGSTMAQQAPQKERKHRTEQRGGKDRKGDRTPEERASRRTEKMSKELGLNKSQTRKLQALNLKQMEQREAMRERHKDGNMHDRGQLQEMEAARAQWDAELKDILTKKQYAQYQAQREQMRAQHKERRGRDGMKNRAHHRHERS